MIDASTSLVVEARELSKTFGNRTALRSIDLEIRRGESVALLGPNGSGKTTLIRLLTSTLRPSAGTFKIAGLDRGSDDRAARRSVGALYHRSFLYDELTARDNLVFFGRLYGVPDVERRVAELLETLGLSSRADDPVSSFSRGMQQRVALARALVHDPEVVFLDEPFTGLDPQSATTLTEALAALPGRGRTILLVTHDLNRVLELCDRWIILHRGRIAAQGASAGLDPAAFRQTYLEAIRRRPAAAGSSS